MAKNQILVTQYFERTNTRLQQIEGKGISKKQTSRKKKSNTKNSMIPKEIWEILYLLVKFCFLYYANSEFPK